MIARKGSSEGYTLLEMIAVLGLLALVLSLTLPFTFQGMQSRRLYEHARTIASMLKTARMEAIARNRESSVEADLLRSTVSIDGKREQLRLDGTVNVKILAARREANREGGAIRFFANGSSTGGTIILQSGERSVAIRVDWLTGKIERMQ
jgi:general secretion pathway protein H